MYESYYGLIKKPFQITTDPNFLWMGKKHRDAFSTLRYGVMDNKGFLLLTGDVGTGKTTLINRLMEDIKGKVYTAKIPDPRLSKYDFYRMVSRYFKLPIEVRTKSDFIEPFSRFLNDAHQEKKSVLLLIDEAQRLKHDLMEEIRLLSNLERQDAKLLNIFFVGQNEFNSLLLHPENRALMRRITITYNIDPLNRDETADYIRHRLKIAGANYEIFSDEAVEEIYDFSNGFPRQINIISDLAMFFASQLDQRTISRKIVRQCRERISFTITEVPVKRHNRIVTSPVSLPTAPKAPPRKISTPLWMAIGAALLLVCGAGFYFTAPEWKLRTRRWIDQLGQPQAKTATMPVETPRTDFHAVNSPAAPVEAVSPAVASDGSQSTRRSEMPLRTPHRPPDVDFLETADVPAKPATARKQPPSTTPPATGVAAAVAPQPDPADAVDWVLKNRRQEEHP